MRPSAPSATPRRDRSQIASDGATWLDRQLVGRDRAQPVEGGFGQDVIDAKRRRVQVLVAQGFAERQGENRILVRRDLLATLEQREVTRVGQELAVKRGAPFRPAKDGERIHGILRSRHNPKILGRHDAEIVGDRIA